MSYSCDYCNELIGGDPNHRVMICAAHNSDEGVELSLSATHGGLAHIEVKFWSDDDDDHHYHEHCAIKMAYEDLKAAVEQLDVDA